MLKSIFTFVLLLFISATSSAFQVNSFNLKVGDSYHIDETQDVVIEQIVMGAPNTVNTSNTSLELLEVIDIDSDGNYSLRLTTLKRRSAISAMMQTVVEDSEDPTAGTGLFVALKNTSFNFTMSKKGEILDVSGLDELSSSLSSQFSANPQVVVQIQTLFSEESVKSTLESRFTYFSDSNDMKWSTESTMAMNGMPVNLITESSYTDNYTIAANSNMTINGSIVQMGTEVNLDLTGTRKATFTLNEVTGVPNNTVVVDDITGNATAMGMAIPMTLTTATKTTFIPQN